MDDGHSNPANAVIEPYLVAWCAASMTMMMITMTTQSRHSRIELLPMAAAPYNTPLVLAALTIREPRRGVVGLPRFRGLDNQEPLRPSTNARLMQLRRFDRIRLDLRHLQGPAPAVIPERPPASSATPMRANRSVLSRLRFTTSTALPPSLSRRITWSRAVTPL